MAEIEQVQTESPKGLDAILDSAIDTHFEQEAPAPEAEVTETPEVKVDATGRAHGADGKFVAKEPAPEAPAQGTPTEQKTAPAPEVSPAPQLVEPHPRWPAELKAEFAKWPPEVQKAFRARDDATEAEYTRKSQEVAEQRKAHEPLLTEFQRQAPLLQRIGYAPDKFLADSTLIATNLMSGNPELQAQQLVHLAQTHRIPPEAVLRAMGVSISPEGTAQALPQEYTQLQQQVFQLQQQLRGFQEQSVLSERQRAQAEFDSIGLTKDANGQPQYPHWDKVKGTMIKLVANDLAATWDEAYKRAVRADDDLYKQEVEAERRRVAENAERERLAAVEKANKARPVRTSNSAPGGQTQVKGLDAHLDAALERAGIS